MRIRPLADRDVDGQLAHLAGEAGERTALAFLEGLESTFRLLVAHPELGSARALADSRLAGLRVHPVRGFPRVLVFYLTEDSVLEVVRVLHSSRDVKGLLGDD